jgi:hypothetical protein
MPEYDKTNRFGLFKNKDKQEDTHADLTGYVNIDGKEFWLNGWVNRNEDGSLKFISGSVKPKTERKEEKKDWASADIRKKFEKQDVEDRGDDSARDEVVLDDDYDGSEPVDLSGIPFN